MLELKKFASDSKESIQKQIAFVFMLLDQTEIILEITTFGWFLSSELSFYYLPSETSP